MSKRKSRRAKRTAPTQAAPPAVAGHHFWRYAALLPILAAIVAVQLDHEKPAPRAPSRLAPAPPRLEDRPRVLARVDGHEITSVDLERYSSVRELSIGVGKRQLLGELCDRALLLLLAAEDRLQLSEESLHSQVMRRRLVLGVTASVSSEPPTIAGTRLGLPGGLGTSGALANPNPFGSAPFGSSDPLEAGESRPSLASEKDLVDEVRAEALAELVKEARIYSKIQVPRSELLAAWRHDPPQQPALPGSPSEEVLQGIRRRIQRQRGAAAVAALLTELRTRWKVELER